MRLWLVIWSWIRFVAQVGYEVMVCDLVMDKVCNQVRKDQGS